MSQADYDVIIVGGRCAGATLAIRLARQQLKVLVVDRATFPSAPAVPSGPFIFEVTMKMLDELGIKESDYALPGSRAQQFVVEFVDHFHAVLPLSQLGLERSYACGLERAHFDNVLWKYMKSHTPYVTARQDFAMTDVLKDESGKVTGIIGKAGNSAEERITADLVVGADGRFSMAARKFGAKLVEERNQFTTGVYNAQWENVLPYNEALSAEISNYNTGRGFMVLFIPVGTARYYVAAYMRSQDAQRGSQTPEEFYISSLKRIPQVWKRLEGAQRVTELEGIRPIENAYREAFGQGWVLVGDAFHYKDPSDGQGVYDALIEAKYLAEAIAEWKSGKLTWEQAGVLYKEKAWAETYSMFKWTVKQVQGALYTFPPPFIIKTLIRWLINDPAYQTKFLQVLARMSDPATVSLMPNFGVIWRGILSSFKSR